jgi:hypothetical protein
LGLTAEEMAFYDALAANEASVRALGDETLRKIARELTDKLRASNSVDWYVPDSVRAKLRLMVKKWNIRRTVRILPLRRYYSKLKRSPMPGQQHSKDSAYCPDCPVKYV